MELVFVGDWSPESGRIPSWEGRIPIGNLECAFSDDGLRSEKAYASILPQEMMERVGASGFAALSLANNHVNDAGNFEETYDELKRRFQSIQFFGTVERPYAEFEIFVNDSGNRTIANQTIRLLVIGCLEPCRSRGPNLFKQEDVTSLIKKIRQSSSQPIRQFVFVFPHWGKEGEYTRYPSPAQRRLAREWIAAGADGVVGNHAHIPQGRETIEGKPVFYCLGNYDFPLGETDAYPASRERMMVTAGFAHSSTPNQAPDSSPCSPWTKPLFTTAAAEDGFRDASSVLDERWTTWRWAQTIGPVMLAKNAASWKIRLKKNFLKTLPKFLVWQCLPKVLLFRCAAFFRSKSNNPKSNRQAISRCSNN